MIRPEASAQLLKLQLSEVVAYYMRRRGVGHTRAQRIGTDMSDCLVMCRRADTALRDYGRKGISLEALPRCLLGMEKPLVIEHDAVCSLLRDALMRIEELEEQTKKIPVLEGENHG